MPNALMPDTSSYADPTGNALLAKGYDAAQAFAPAQAMQGLQMNQQVMKLRDAQIGQEQLTLGRAKLQALNGVLGGLVTNPTAENATDQIGWAVQNGVIDPQSATKAASEVAALGGDPAKIKAWATDHLNQNAQHQQLMDQAYGTPTMLSNGASSSPAMVRQGAGGGYYPGAGPTVQQQLSPEAATAPQTGPINPDGSPTQTTRGAAVQSQGGLPATVDPFGRIAYPGRGAPSTAAAPAGAQQPAPTPSAPAQPGAPQQPAAPTQPGPTAAHGPEGPGIPPGPVTDSLYKRALETVAAVQNMDPRQMSARDQQAATMATNLVARYQREQATPAAGQGGAPAAPAPAGGAVPPGRQPPAPVQAPGVAQGGAQPGPITVGLPAGQAEARTAMGVQGANRLTQIQGEASTGPEQLAALNNLQAQLGKVSTGPLAGRINTAKASFNQIANMLGQPGIDPQGVAAYDEIHKSAAQLAGAAMSAFGAGTNDKLALAIAQNPSEALSNMSNQQVIPLIKGGIAAKQVKAEAANAYVQQHGGDPSSVGAFETDWNKNASPRAFQFAYMTPAQRQDLYASMNPAEQKQLLSAVQTAESRGWISAGAAK